MPPSTNVLYDALSKIGSERLGKARAAMAWQDREGEKAHAELQRLGRLREEGERVARRKAIGELSNHDSMSSCLTQGRFDQGIAQVIEVRGDEDAIGSVQFKSGVPGS